jgi:hypothetical protein
MTQKFIPQQLSCHILWKLSIQFRQSGSKKQHMPIAFAVPAVDNHPAKPKLCGLIADRLFTPKIINVSGKSFIVANANRLGGHGVMIVHRQNFAIGR